MLHPIYGIGFFSVFLRVNINCAAACSFRRVVWPSVGCLWIRLFAEDLLQLVEQYAAVIIGICLVQELLSAGSGQVGFLQRSGYVFKGNASGTVRVHLPECLEDFFRRRQVGSRSHQ